MSPATIAIIPLVLLAAGIWAGWFHHWRKEPASVDDAAIGATIFTGITAFALSLIAYFMGVVYFNSWEI